MTLESGPVLIDFICPADPSISCTQSGYRIGQAILTVAPLSVQNVADVLGSFKINCYGVDSSSSKVSENYSLRVCYVWASDAIDGLIGKLSKFNLRPYTFRIKDGLNFDTPRIRFVLLTFDRKNVDREVYETIQQVSKTSKNHQLVRGQDLFTIYAPFGANEFMNSCSRGSLSNQLGQGVYLVDGRLAPGCEGAPVYTSSNEKRRSNPIGLVLFPIASGKEHSGYSLVVPFHMISEELLKFSYPHQIEKEPDPNTSPCLSGLPVQEAIQNTVIVEIPGSWGSGVVVGRGLVMTNSHVIGFGNARFVNVRWKSHSTRANILFHSNKSSLLDIALLQYDENFGSPGIRISRDEPQRGEKVVAVGHPLQTDNGIPSLSKGIITNYWAKSAGFSTSCIVNAGSSGGAIIREDGALLGIVVGLCKADEEAYPELNICIASSVFKTPLQAFMTTGEISSMESLLHVDDPWLRAVMRMPKCKY